MVNQILHLGDLKNTFVHNKSPGLCRFEYLYLAEDNEVEVDKSGKEDPKLYDCASNKGT